MDIREEGKKQYAKLKAEYGSDLIGLFRDRIAALPKQTTEFKRLIDVDILYRSWMAVQAKTCYENYPSAPGAGEVIMEGLGIPCVKKSDDPHDYIAELELLIKRVSEFSFPVDLTENEDTTIEFFITVDCLCRRWACFASTKAYKKFRVSYTVYRGL